MLFALINIIFCIIFNSLNILKTRLNIIIIIWNIIINHFFKLAFSHTECLR